MVVKVATLQKNQNATCQPQQPIFKTLFENNIFILSFYYYNLRSSS